MNIGIIGTGNMGRALGLRWAEGGHRVLFGSRNPDKAKAVAASAPAGTRTGDFDDAAEFGEVVLYTVRDVLPSALLRRPEALVGKVLIDCNNSETFGLDAPDPQGRPGIHFPMLVPSHAERLAADAPRAHVIKAFNTLPAPVIELGRQALAAHRVSVFLCGDDARAKAVVKGLAEELGFIGVDSGELERAQNVEALADFVRLQILGLGRGVFTTLSLATLQEA